MTVILILLINPSINGVLTTYPYTYYCYFKAGTVSSVKFGAYNTTSAATLYGTFDLTAVTAVSSGTITAAVAITDVGNGWRLCSVYGDLGGSEPDIGAIKIILDTGYVYAYNAKAIHYRWTQSYVSLADGYSDPIGGLDSSCIIPDSTTNYHRILYNVRKNSTWNFSMYFKISNDGYNLDVVFATGAFGAACTINKSTGVISSSQNCTAKTTVINGWVKIDMSSSASAADGTLRIYPWGNAPLAISSTNKVYIYNPTLDNNQPIFLNDLSGNNRTFKSNLSASGYGGIVDSSTATKARFGQQSLTFVNSFCYINTDPPNNDYTIIILAAFDSRRTSQTSNQFLFVNTNAAGTEKHVVGLYNVSSTANDTKAICQFTSAAGGGPTNNILDYNYNGTDMLFFNCYFPTNGSLVGNFNNKGATTLAKSGVDRIKTKMFLGNSAAFTEMTYKMHWFEAIILNGSLTDNDKVALTNYIKATYIQNIF